MKITVVPPPGPFAEPQRFSAEAYSIADDRLHMHEVTVLGEDPPAQYHALSMPIPRCIVFVSTEPGEML